MGMDGQRQAPASFPPVKRPVINFKGGWVGIGTSLAG